MRAVTSRPRMPVAFRGTSDANKEEEEEKRYRIQAGRCTSVIEHQRPVSRSPVRNNLGDRYPVGGVPEFRGAHGRRREQPIRNVGCNAEETRPLSLVRSFGRGCSVLRGRLGTGCRRRTPGCRSVCGGLRCITTASPGKARFAECTFKWRFRNFICEACDEFLRYEMLSNSSWLVIKAGKILSKNLAVTNLRQSQGTKIYLLAFLCFIFNMFYTFDLFDSYRTP